MFNVLKVNIKMKTNLNFHFYTSLCSRQQKEVWNKKFKSVFSLRMGPGLEGLMLLLSKIAEYLWISPRASLGAVDDKAPQRCQWMLPVSLLLALNTFTIKNQSFCLKIWTNYPADKSTSQTDRPLFLKIKHFFDGTLD